MARYIDADKFKSQLEHAMEKMHFICGVKGVDVGAVIKALDMQPAADVVEVVRCEKCKFAEMVVDIIGNPHLFCKECNFREVDFDDFCSKGKRRENDG